MTWKRFWCALRDHPYPRVTSGGKEAYDAWISGEEPFAPPSECSNCGKVFWNEHNRSMGS